MFTPGQLVLRIITHLDILGFFGVLFASAVSEIYVCKSEPIPISRLLVFISSGNFSNYTDDPSINYYNTVWDYRTEFLSKALEHGVGWYHVLYISCWALIVAYFVTEVWLYCILLKGINFRKRFLHQWLLWRFLILKITATFFIYNVIWGNHVTCTDIFVIPFWGWRICHVLLVAYFSYSIKPNKLLLEGNDEYN